MSRTARPTLSERGHEALRPFERYLEAQELSPPTLRNYLSDLRQFIAWWENEADPGQPFHPEVVQHKQIERYQAYLEADLHLKPATLNRYLSSVRRYFAWAAEADLIPRDPARSVRLIEQTHHDPRHLTDAEEAAIVAEVRLHGSLRDRALIILMLETGLRVQEVLELKRSDLLPGPQLLVHGPRGKERRVPVSPAAWGALEPYMATVESGADYLFTSEKTGGALTERALGYILHKYADQAGVEEVSPHCLRHRFGYRMAATTPVVRLAELMGHDSLDTTMVYVRGSTEAE